MKDYLFAAPFLHPPGGGEGVANWMVQTLAERGRLTVLTWDPIDYARVDEYYGTRLCELNFEKILIAPVLRNLLRVSRLPHEMLKLGFLMGKVKRMRHQFRFCFAAHNELDLGPGAVNYVHYPCLDFQELKSHPWPRNRFARAIWPYYISACLAPARWSIQGVRESVTLANSHWTAQQYIDRYQAPVHRVLYPPALGHPRPHSGERRNAFISIGRVDRSKNWPRLISIIETVRAEGHQVELTLVGSPGDPDLLEELRNQAEQRPWLRLVLNLNREKLDELIATHRFGLHGMHNEHYGMAVAELVLGGCLTLVHDSGGQIEIVREEQARYANEDDAVRKILALLESPELCATVLKSQSARRERLTREAFIEGFGRFLDELESARLQADFGPSRPALPPPQELSP